LLEPAGQLAFYAEILKGDGSTILREAIADRMKLFNRIGELISRNQPSFPRGKAGARAYAVGDIHGRMDLLQQLLEMIEADIRALPHRTNYIVFLGDLIDRGPQSAEVVEKLRTFRPDWATPIFVAGNHEEVMLRVLNCEDGLLSSWLKFGGSECLQSYGIDVEDLKQRDEATALHTVRQHVPQGHLDFIKSFGDTFRFGDYLLVHAGIRPGVTVEEQDVRDLRWIRDPFLSDEHEHGFVVVHGHTISETVEERANRIGIDTGAYRSGKLTALALEDERRWLLCTNDPREALSTST
jgi:serine/threonine protein phosphatase 1